MFSFLLRLKKGSRRLVLAVFVAFLLLLILFAGSLLGKKKNSLAPTPVHLTLNESTQLLPRPNGFLAVQENQVSAYDWDGKEAWNYAMGQGKISAASGAGLVALWKDAELVILGQDGRVEFSGPMHGPIRSVCCGEGQAAILVEGDSSLLVVDKSGKTLDTITVKQEQLLDFSYDAGDLLCVWTLDASGVRAQCALSTYQAGKLLTANYAFQNEIFYDACFDDRDLYLVGTTSLYTLPISASVAQAEKTVLRGWTLVDKQKHAGRMTLLFAALKEDGTQDLTHLKIIRDGEVTEKSVPPCKHVFLSGEQLCALSDTALFVRSLKEGTSKTYTLSDEVLDFYGDHAHFLVKHASKAVIYHVSDK